MMKLCRKAYWTALLVPIFLLLVQTGCREEDRSRPAGFEIHPDFQLALVASEPLVFDPVDMEFDEKGGAYVLEMPGYPLSDEGSRLVLLEDTDGDGVYDRRHIYADNLGVASSFMPYKGGMLVASPPDLVWLRDTDQDNTADESQVIMSGFSVGNLQHNFNGLTYGLDNWIYAANGGNSGRPYFKNHPDTPLDMRGGDLRFRLEDEQLVRVGESSGGFELAFDNYGRMFGTHNVKHVSNLVFEGRYIDGVPVSPRHSLNNISDHEENGLSRIYPIGEQETRVNHPEQSGYFSGACGITFYGGGAFPEGFNDHIFVADVVLNLVHLDVLSPDGASFKASRMRDKVDFLASSDRSFRPVNMTTGPDGALYLLDMHRDVIEHPEWIPDEIEDTLDLSAGKEIGRIYRITPSGWTPQRTELNPGDLSSLVRSLENKNQWVRLTAQRLLVENNEEEAVPLLEDLFRDSQNPLARLHCLWTLEGLKSLKNDLLIHALGDASSGVRENAVKIAEIRLNDHPQLVDNLLTLTSDRDARVRMQAILTLGTLEDRHYRPVSSKIADALVQIMSQYSTDTWTQMAVASAVKGQPVDFSRKLLAGQETPVGDGQLQIVRTLSRLVGRHHDAEAAQALLGLLPGSDAVTPAMKAGIIDALAEGWKVGKPGTMELNAQGLSAALASIETGGEVSVMRAAGNLRKAMGLPVSPEMGKLIADAKASVLDEELPVEKRLELLELISLEGFDKREALLYRLLDSREPVALQKEALSQLRASDKPGIGRELLRRWPTLGPEARKLAGNILLYKAQNHDLLLSALENGEINAGELNLDLERRRVLLFSDDEAVKRRAEALFSDAGVVQRKEAIEKMRPALALAGNVEKGSEHFNTLCSSCHQYGNTGKDVGPVLTEINRKSKESLLHDILDPNAAVDTRYLNHSVRTKDGNIYVGMVYQETDTDITLRMQGGIEKTIGKEDIEDLSSLGVSLMPEGLEAGLSHQDMADLLAFLQHGLSGDGYTDLN